MKNFLRKKREFLQEEDKYFFPLPLKANKPLFYVQGEYLLSLRAEYLSALINDYEEKEKFFFSRHITDILMARIFSEVEGTLSIENVTTTRKKIEAIRKASVLTDKNDIIVKNMLNAFDYIMKDTPAFNKENLRKLYGILSQGCLEKGDELKPEAYYRDDAVCIGGYDGAPAEEIEEMMDSLFSFAGDSANAKKYGIFLPLIAHYYILYVHPYFDYNGRTARMVSLWLSFLHNITMAPLFISEAINEEKKAYYRAIVNTRETENDLTYFFGYVLESSIKYSYVYKNLEALCAALEKEGIFLSSSEKLYVKKIIIHAPTGYFNAKKFAGFIKSEVSRQALHKILSAFTSYGILEKNQNKKGETIYRLKEDLLFYSA